MDMSDLPLQLACWITDDANDDAVGDDEYQLLPTTARCLKRVVLESGRLV